ncbi:hypothetical protein [Ktedonobacter robiniae]|uniref:hypothetical protein n=1 Tax=Ktedonobacter robiniae TaxID=2778365 RepID=UPI00191696CB|nr:hypothetical protein [Ktedonobacter robiniae]
MTNVEWCLRQFEVAYILKYKEKMPVATQVMRRPSPKVIPLMQKSVREEQALLKKRERRAPPSPLESHFSVWDRSERVRTGVTKDFDVALWIQWPSLICEYTEIVLAEDGQEAIEILMRKHHVMYVRRAAVRAVGEEKIDRYHSLWLTSRQPDETSH